MNAYVSWDLFAFVTDEGTESAIDDDADDDDDDDGRIAIGRTTAVSFTGNFFITYS